MHSYNKKRIYKSNEAAEHHLLKNKYYVGSLNYSKLHSNNGRTINKYGRTIKYTNNVLKYIQIT